jgi:hypothetical protein
MTHIGEAQPHYRDITNDRNWRGLIGPEHWQTHWSNLEGIEQKMKEAQQHATAIRSAIMTARRS